MHKYNPDLREEELTENPELKKQIIYKKELGLNSRNPAQLINTYEFSNKWGKINCVVTGNTRIGSNIAKLPSNNFGCISEMNIHTLPQSYLSRAGIEKTTLNQISKSYNGIDLISRRFASLIIRESGYINGIPYWNKKDKNNILNIVCRNDGEHHYINGYELRQLILGIIDEVRRNNPKCFYEYETEINNPFEADRVIVLRVEHYLDIDGNKYRPDETMLVNDYVKSWKFPRFNMEYLFGLLEELNSGEYYMDIDIPIIYDVFKYPIKCTDTHIRPLTDKQHNKNKDDYDLGQYIWDDY